MRISDWSSDVCSYDLEPGYSKGGPHAIRGNIDSFIGQGEWKNAQSPELRRNHSLYSGKDTVYLNEAVQMLFRISEERRVGKEWVSTCSSRRSLYQSIKLTYIATCY